jgi:transcriptional regulator with XRE-family HTH domain
MVAQKQEEKIVFYDKYAKLCQQKGITPTAAALEIGLSKATPTKWKTSGATPSGENLKKIAVYFGITESELLSDKKIQLTTNQQQVELREELRDNPAFRILYDTLKDATDADMLEAAAIIARRKEERGKG